MTLAHRHPGWFTDGLPLFRFSQFEVPWALGPPAGRYLMRPPGDRPDAPPAFVLLFSTLGAPERRRLARRRRAADPEPGPVPVSTGRATVISVTPPFADPAAAAAWLRAAGEADLAADLATLNHAVHAFRLVTADPHRHTIAREQLLVARIGYGGGDEVADGRWSEALELDAPGARERRAKVLEPQARLAAALGRREPALLCEELALRALLDLEEGRHREAALQLLVALDAALAELPNDPRAGGLAERIAELRERRPAVGAAAQSALAGPLDEAEREAVASTLHRIEAALRARAVANA